MPLPIRYSEAGRGWDSNFVAFAAAKPSAVLRKLNDFVTHASHQEISSWQASVPHLQREVDETIRIDAESGQYTAILEYRLPLEMRRVDALFLLHDRIVVIELKGKELPSEADIDQAHAYARDLRYYHRECHDREVKAVVIPTRMEGKRFSRRGVEVCPPQDLDAYMAAINTKACPTPVNPQRFLSGDAYKPLPSLIQAARELFQQQKMPQLWQSLAATDGAVHRIEEIVQDAERTRTRRLILLTGVPGAGKTLVGLRLVHADFLDKLDRTGQGAPAIFLSGNAPLVEVLQYEVKKAGGVGKTFVRGVKDYVSYYASSHRSIPHHVLVFDEAQRAFDAQTVAQKHGIPLEQADSEPHHFIAFAERLPDWAVVVGLIGTGQEINKGEEGGLGQWKNAIRESLQSRQWHVHGPPDIADHFKNTDFVPDNALTLNTSLRSHFALHLDRYVDHLVSDNEPKNEEWLKTVAVSLEQQGFDLRLCRHPDMGKDYLRERYGDQREKRFGMISSSRDKTLTKDLDPEFCFPQISFQLKWQYPIGPWFADDEFHPSAKSCRHLNISMTEFETQGLELDGVLLGWGTDFLRQNGQWNISRMRRYQNKRAIKNPLQLRANCYRVLLTRARDVTIVYVPPVPIYDETYTFLERIGFRPL